MGRPRRPATPSDSAAIARALRSDSDLMRYAEWWVRRRIYGLEDEAVRWLVAQYTAAYKTIINTLHEAYDEKGQPVLAQRARLLAQIEREINALYAGIGAKVPQDVENGFRQGYYGRAWLLDTVTVPEWNAAKHVLLPSEAIRALLLNEYVGADEWIGLGRRQLIDRIKRSLTASMIAGEGIKPAAARLQRELGLKPGQTQNFKGDAYRTLLIARTEILRASNIGAMTVYEQNQDVLKGWEWVSARDERTCPICGGLDGKVFPFNSRQAQPPSGSHPGCRCTVMPVLIDEDLMERVSGVRQTYCEWAAQNGIVDDADLCSQRGASAHAINATSDSPVSDVERYQQENRAALDLARGISPDVINRGATKGDLFDYMVDFFAYDKNAQPVYSSVAMRDAFSDLQLGTYRLGRGMVPQQTINDIRLRAAGLLGADGYLTSSTITSQERGLLMLLASSDDDIVLTAIDDIRDKRLKGTIAWTQQHQERRGKLYDNFISAAQEDAARMLRDYNTWQ